MYDDSEPKGGVVSSASIGAPQIGERADLGTGLDSQHGKERTDSLKANPAPSPFLKIMLQRPKPFLLKVQKWLAP